MLWRLGLVSTVARVLHARQPCDCALVHCSLAFLRARRAPYSDTTQKGQGSSSAATFSKGIWRSIYLARVPRAAISHLVPHVSYLGDYPTQILNEESKGDFEARIRVHVWAAAAGRGELFVESEWGQRNMSQVSFPTGDSNFTLTLRAPKTTIKLWWPVGVGAQPLYAVNATLRFGAASVTASRKIGFRYAVLVTGDDTNAQYVQRAATEQGTELHGMMFRVNGAAMFTRGANMM